MAFTALTPREICIVLTLIGAVLLAIRLSEGVSRAVWAGLLVVGIANAIVMTSRPHNLLHPNLAHYYLGAKYSSIPYLDFYRTINAALGKAQIGMRDLAEPGRFVRETDAEQRAYYIDLMREQGVAFDPFVSLGELRDRAALSGSLAREARKILAENLPENRIDGFRRDVRLAISARPDLDITRDAGFNGSPFYTLVRHLDPSLYKPFGLATAWLNVAFQSLAVVCLTWLVGLAFGLSISRRLAMAALVFASSDFVSFALPGLIFAGLWVPVAVALYAAHRRSPAVSGIAIAWAGLIKLFPLVLLLPAGARLVKAPVGRLFAKQVDGSPKPWLRILAWCAAATAVLAFAAAIGGRSWLGFFDKISAQFAPGLTAGNNVSLSRGLSTLGITTSLSPLPVVLSVLSLAAVTAMFLPGDDKKCSAALPRRSLVLLASLAWVAHKWLNYYAVASLLLLPLLAQRHRVGASVAVAATAFAAFLPEFDDPVLAAYPALLGLKLLPYLTIPAWTVLLEFRDRGLSIRVRRVALSMCLLCLLAVVGETWRMHAIRTLGAEAKTLINRGNAKDAIDAYKRLARLTPRNREVYNGLAVAYIIDGDVDNAGKYFERAVQLGPTDAGLRHNYGRFLSRTGRLEAAGEEFEASLSIYPFDEAVLQDLAGVRYNQGQITAARDHLSRALELDPSNEKNRNLLYEVQKRTPND